MPLWLLLALAGCDRWTQPLKDGPTGDDAWVEPIPPRPGALASHVVVLVLDGTRIEESFGDPDAWSDAAGTTTGEVLPTVRADLLPEGTLVLPGLNAGITITAPAHCDLLTGARENFAHYTNLGGAGRYRPTLPTLYEILAQDHAIEEGKLILGGNSEHLLALDHSVYPGATDESGATFELVADPAIGEGSASNDDKYTLEEIQARLAATRPELLVANLHGIDRAGHYGHWDDDDDNDTPDVYNPAGYADKVKFIDKTLASLWEWIQSDGSGMKGTTVLVLVGDHGRHRWGDEAEERLEGDPDPHYKNHGDQCAGCRQIPMFVAGPGIVAGAEIQTTHTIEDLSRTIARVLGVDHPYATGLLMHDLFEEPPDAAEREGDLAVDANGGAVAWQRWTADPDARSEVVVDDVVVSSAGALLAEAPRLLADGDSLYACWRELHVDGGGIDMPWTGHCALREGDAWTDLTFPVEMVYPLWDPALALDVDGRLLVAWADNPAATTYGDERAAQRLYRWSATAGWEGTDAGPSAVFPTEPSVAVAGGAAWVAFAASDLGPEDDQNPGRYTRHISVQRVLMGDDGGASWNENWRTYNAECPAEAACVATTPTLDVDGNAWDRMESPAIGVGNDGMHVAFLGFDAAGTSVLLASSSDAGASWSTLQPLDDSGRVFGHVRPRWYDERVYWARLGQAGFVDLCRRSPGDDAASCVQTTSPRIHGFAPNDEGVLASLDAGTGSWELQTITWP